MATEEDNIKIADENVVEEPREQPLIQGDGKVEILLKAVADAPMLKTKKFKIKSDTTIRTLVQNVRKMLKLDANDDQVFLFINQTFSPSLDQNLDNLFNCYQTDGKLTLYYSKTLAWG